MAFSLQATILSRLPLEEVERICSNFSVGPLSQALQYSCPWELWRERAEILYNCPAQFFDLALTDPLRQEEEDVQSGLQRYIEVSNLYRLDERALFTLFEPLAAAIEGQYRSSKIEFPLSRGERIELRRLEIYPASQFNLSSDYEIVRSSSPWLESLRKRVGRSELSYRDLFYYLRLAYFQAFEFLFSEVRTGRLRKGDFLKEVLRSGSSLLFNQTISFYLPQLGESFNVDQSETDLLLSPRQSQAVFGVSYYQILAAATYGCNLRVIDFFLDLFSQNALTDVWPELYPAYAFHQKPLALLGILERLDDKEIARLWRNSRLVAEVDFLAYLLQRRPEIDTDLIEHLARNIQGALPSLRLLLNNLRGRDFYYKLLDSTSENFPLSRAIIEEKISLSQE